MPEEKNVALGRGPRLNLERHECENETEDRAESPVPRTHSSRSVEDDESPPCRGWKGVPAGGGGTTTGDHHQQPGTVRVMTGPKLGGTVR